MKTKQYLDLEKFSIVLITSSQAGNKGFGTGFIIHNQAECSFLVTCSHVINDLGGDNFLLVEEVKATVVAKSNQADDLAVLRIHTGDDQKSIIPLCNHAIPGLLFKSFGYSVFDPKHELFDLDEISGMLIRKRLIRGAGQPLIDCWEIRVNDADNLLEKGHSGSPIIDEVSSTVLGVISHRGIQGKTGRIVAINNLSNVWTDIPEKLIRNNRYCLSSISLLLNDCIKNQKDFLSFFDPDFPDLPLRDLPFLVGIEYIILICHQTNSIDELLDLIKKRCPNRYKRYNSDIYCQSKSLKKGITNKYIFPLSCIAYYLSKKEQKTNNSRAIINTKGVFPEPLTLSEAKINAIAKVLGLPRNEIQIIFIREGSIKIEIELPSKSLDRLIKLFEERTVLMRDLGVNYVMESFAEGYIIKNIKKLILNEYTTNSLLFFIKKNYPQISKEISSHDNKLKIVDYLVDQVQTKSTFSSLLNMIEIEKGSIVRNYEPFIKVPRRPKKTKEQKFKSKDKILSYVLGRMPNKVRAVIAAITGCLFASISTALVFYTIDSMVRFSVDNFIFGFYSPIELFGGLCKFFWIIVLGDWVGQIVVQVSGSKKGLSTARLAQRTFFAGLLLAPVFYILIEISSIALFGAEDINALLGVEDIEMIETNWGAIGRFVIFLIFLVIFVVMLYVSESLSSIPAALSTIFTILGAIRGGQSAYNRGR